MYWHKKAEGTSPEQMREAIKEIQTEIERRLAMGPIERDVAQRMQYGRATFDDVRQSLLILARAIDAHNKN